MALQFGSASSRRCVGQRIVAWKSNGEQLIPVVGSIGCAKVVEAYGVYYTSFLLCNVAVDRIGGFLARMDGATFWLMHARIVGTSSLVFGTVAVCGGGCWYRRDSHCRSLFRPRESGRTIASNECDWGR